MSKRIFRGLSFLVPLILTGAGAVFLYKTDLITKTIITWIFRIGASCITGLILLFLLILIYSYTKMAMLVLFKIDTDRKSKK